MSTDESFAHDVRADGTANLRGWWITTLGADALEAVLAGLDPQPDWLGLDLEHGSLTVTDVVPILRVAAAAGIPVLARLPGHDSTVIARILDAGPAGIIVPAVSTPEQARAIVTAACPPPLGARGTGLARAHLPLDPAPNKQPLVLVMIETAQGYALRTEIAQVAGVDGLFVGPYDLSVSMGLPGPKDPAVLEAISGIIHTAGDFGLAHGYFAGDPVLIEQLPGVDLLAVDSDISAIRSGVTAMLGP